MDFLSKSDMFGSNEIEVPQEESTGQIGWKSQRKIIKVLKQTGKQKKFERSSTKHALPSGKRISKTGKVYWETRKNRSYLPKLQNG
jgi:hypothetical protein